MSDPTLETKCRTLRETLQTLAPLAVAFSGGTDSAFLLAVAHETLGKSCTAVTVRSVLQPSDESAAAETFCRERGIPLITLDLDPLAIRGFAANPPDRCYLCKKALFTKMKQTAANAGFPHLADGSNTDDTGDYRPGMRALAELGIASPLRDSGFSKADIRNASQSMGLPTWDKPAAACLASRIAYGETVTREKLAAVDKAETWLHDRGFRVCRVRTEGKTARIEIEKSAFAAFLPLADEADAALKALGFTYVSLDLGGFRSGNMNKALATPR